MGLGKLISQCLYLYQWNKLGYGLYHWLSYSKDFILSEAASSARRRSFTGTSTSDPNPRTPSCHPRLQSAQWLFHRLPYAFLIKGSSEVVRCDKVSQGGRMFIEKRYGALP